MCIEWSSHNVHINTSLHALVDTTFLNTAQFFLMGAGVYTGACVVKNMLAMYLKYHKAGLTPSSLAKGYNSGPPSLHPWRI